MYYFYHYYHTESVLLNIIHYKNTIDKRLDYDHLANIRMFSLGCKNSYE